MFDVRPILYIVGWLLLVLAGAMLIPMLADLAVGEDDWKVFAVSSALTLFFGVLLVLTNRQAHIVLTLRQTFVLTTLVWIVICLFSSLPFMLSSLRLGFAAAFFEAMSGLTTTGASVISDVEVLPPGILLWRALLVWLGGIGIVGLGIVILPFLRVGGMQLFRSESSDKSDKIAPRAADLALAFGWVYIALTVACATAFALSGMPVFDAVCHAMSALGTGGFSTRNLSIGAYESAAVEWWAILFMLLGSLPFVRFISMAQGHVGALWHDSQVRIYLLVLLAATLPLALHVWAAGFHDAHDALRHSAFTVVSIVTTTGFASTDYLLWGPGPAALILLLTLIGGCTGSTSGGIKIFRFEVLWLSLHRQITRLFSPNRVVPLAYNGKAVDGEVITAVMGFVFLYMALIFLIAVGLGMTGLDLVTSVSGAASALGNVGPGLSPLIGPVGNYAPLQDEAMWLMSLGMLLGRLELFTVLVLLTPAFWRT
ncbi:MAG: hypothetical protein RLY86_1563 [Pseudomonadota bacterium]|jgi:trk system potassium uptake protein TrkH